MRQKKALNVSVCTTQSVTNKSERAQIDAQASMGMGATNTLARVAASLGNAGLVSPEFQPAQDVSRGGVLLAIPALLSQGLLANVEEHFELSSGYYLNPTANN